MYYNILYSIWIEKNLILAQPYVILKKRLSQYIIVQVKYKIWNYGNSEKSRGADSDKSYVNFDLSRFACCESELVL